SLAPAGAAGAAAGAPGAGGARIELSGSVWTYPGFAPAGEIAASWAERISQGRFAELAGAFGVADQAALDATAAGLLEWAASPAALFAMPHVQALIRLPA
ncbi:MAG: hypothetical protein LBD51_09725, partial [Bifidobacteriaceae bacterium]|nr:hypothetical protein [Bifidobacteriaceae bacterium]